MKIAGIWNGHDCSYCILDNGVPVIHAELERYSREKEPPGDSYKLFLDTDQDPNSIEHWITCEETHLITKGIKKANIPPCKDFNHEFYAVGHHQAHAANAFFSSNMQEALIVTIDGGGMEQNQWTATTVWKGIDNKIYPYTIIPKDHLNIGNIWSRVTSQVFGLNTGYPYGHQAGTVMATTCLGNKDRYLEAFAKNPYGFCDTWHMRPEKDDDQAKYDVAAAVQEWTELQIKSVIANALKWYPSENLCLAGGVVLNCVMTPKIYDWFDIKDIYVTPTPHDGGLTIGAAQFLWHHELDNPRINWKDNFSPYLGELHSLDSIKKAIEKNKEKLISKVVTDEDVLQLLNDQKIISVFGGGSESGRRALGNRSILADPRSDKMKDIINKKVKHRQWFRPFAPSILREAVGDWFEKDIDSPYMNFAVKFKEDMKDKVPAVVHLDGTGRIQTVTENDNSWYYNFIKQWEKISGVPILLNTSFNDREPIVETPDHAINCFMGTNIDYLYFRELNLLIERK